MESKIHNSGKRIFIGVLLSIAIMFIWLMFSFVIMTSPDCHSWETVDVLNEFKPIVLNNNKISSDCTEWKKYLELDWKWYCLTMKNQNSDWQYSGWQYDNWQWARIYCKSNNKRLIELNEFKKACKSGLLKNNTWTFWIWNKAINLPDIWQDKYEKQWALTATCMSWWIIESTGALIYAVPKEWESVGWGCPEWKHSFICIE